MAIYRKISNGIEMQGCDLYHYLLTAKGYCCERGWNWEDLDTQQIMQGREWVKYWEQYGDPCTDSNVPVITNCWLWGAATPFNWGDNVIIEPNEWGESCTPKISISGGGSPLLGSVLVTTNGVWYSDTGVTGYTYQWYRGASVIVGATNSTYILVLADVSQSITCQVVATDVDGSSAPVSSNAIVFIDAEAQAHFDRVIADGGTIPLGLTALNDFVVSVKNNYSVASVNTAMWALKPHWGISGIKTASGTGATAGGRATSVLYDICGVNGDFIQTTASAQPLALVHSGTNYAWLSGVAGNYFSTPNAVANQITGDIDIKAQVSFSSISSTMTICSKFSLGQRSFNFQQVSSGSLGFTFTLDGATTNFYQSSVSHPYSIGQIGWVRVTRSSTSGVVIFYTSTDGITWTQLGTTVLGITGNMFNSTSVLEIGSLNIGLGSLLNGTIQKTTISNSIGGAPVVDFNPSSYNRATSQTSWVSATGETWTLNTASTNNALKATIVDQTMIMGNGTSYGMRAPSLNINDTAITSYTVFRKFVNTLGEQRINELGASSATSAGKSLRINNVANNERVDIYANVGQNSSTYTSTDLSLKVATAVNNIANANESLPYLINNVSPSAPSPVAIADNTTAMNATGYNFLARNNAASFWANVIAIGDIVVKGEDDNTKRTAMFNLLKTLSKI
jgi:hypothetical protein